MGAPRAPLLQARQVVRAALRRPHLPPRAARAAHRHLTRYRIDPARSRVWIDASSSVHPIHSETDGLVGEIVLGDDGNITEGHLSLPVDRLRSGNPLEDRELKRRIEAGRFPTIDGVLVAAQQHEEQLIVEGDITFRGVTRRYEEPMAIEAIDASTIVLRGSTIFDVRDFGMEPPRILLLRVHPEVTVRIELVAELAQ